jgi:hypothetical protein
MDATKVPLSGAFVSSSSSSTSSSANKNSNQEDINLVFDVWKYQSFWGLSESLPRQQFYKNIEDRIENVFKEQEESIPAAIVGLKQQLELPQFQQAFRNLSVIDRDWFDIEIAGQITQYYWLLNFIFSSEAYNNIVHELMNKFIRPFIKRAQQIQRFWGSGVPMLIVEFVTLDVMKIVYANEPNKVSLSEKLFDEKLGEVASKGSSLLRAEGTRFVKQMFEFFNRPTDRSTIVKLVSDLKKAEGERFSGETLTSPQLIYNLMNSTGKLVIPFLRSMVYCLIDAYFLHRSKRARFGMDLMRILLCLSGVKRNGYDPIIYVFIHFFLADLGLKGGGIQHNMSDLSFMQSKSVRDDNMDMYSQVIFCKVSCDRIGRNIRRRYMDCLERKVEVPTALFSEMIEFLPFMGKNGIKKSDLIKLLVPKFLTAEDLWPKIYRAYVAPSTRNSILSNLLSFSYKWIGVLPMLFGMVLFIMYGVCVMAWLLLGKPALSLQIFEAVSFGMMAICNFIISFYVLTKACRLNREQTNRVHDNPELFDTIENQSSSTTSPLNNKAPRGYFELRSVELCGDNCEFDDKSKAKSAFSSTRGSNTTDFFNDKIALIEKDEKLSGKKKPDHESEDAGSDSDAEDVKITVPATIPSVSSMH